ncbi:trophoblast glycoprotein-like [Hemicordylus capensis]|uniref:trophoblast glycoprotein-like n=1 Tax=Hemicordylus capensis TaxID=884348 RepID=UPI002302B27C|nr:trophoblast glycoprotein-like [Hemicordylus capensis]XP_053160912.1 trophoblast glycoprotein-like [Hemicordylus capensis]XP_053160913.1 trophoblast glycoprotein-like [Hemicordylus capensis]
MAQRPPAGHGRAPPLLARALQLAAGMLLLPLLQAARSCPSSSCFCFTTPDTVQCRFVRLQEPPAELPSAAHNLTIVGGNLTVLRAAAFAGGWARGEPARPLGNLTLLVLTHDCIEELEDSAFAGLPALRALDLSRNPLRAIAPGAFAGCARLRTLRLNQVRPAPGSPPLEELLGGALANLSLERLELAGNRLRELPPAWTLPAGLERLDVRNNSLRALRAAQLDGLEALGQLRLELASNPLRCDCASLRPLMVWLRNATWRVPDLKSLHCASPREVSGAAVLRLRPSQLDCLDAAGWGLLQAGGQEELETASYVFFGIVLALIGVVFLMVLYLNRKGIKRWLNNLREACRDQMEGYHYRYEQDSDPRRVSPGDL